MRTGVLGALAWVFVLLGAPVLGDDVAIPGEGMTSREAAREAQERTRFLVVVRLSSDCSVCREFERKTLRNRSVRAWLLWHAVLDLQKVRGDRGCSPTIRVHLRDRPVLTISRECLVGSERMPELGIPGAGPAPGIAPTPITRYPTALDVLLKLDMLMDATRSKEPVWAALHDRKNPMPEAPPPGEPLSMGSDNLAPPVYDPAGPEEMLDRLERAREAVRAGDLERATGEYTWLWERADRFDPALRPARVSFIAEEMRALARRRDGAHERFAGVRAALEERSPWWTFHEILDWITLNTVLGEEETTLEHMIELAVDDQNAALMTATEAVGYRILCERPLAPDPWSVDRGAMRALELARKAIGRERPALAAEEEWDAVAGFARRWVLDEGCRLYAALLARERDEEALRVAGLVLEEHDTAAARAALVMTALVVDQAREHQRAWLDEAAAMGGGRPDLRARVDAALGR